MNRRQRNIFASEPEHSGVFVVLSWAVVLALLAIIFYMSAQTGEELDTETGIVSLVRDWLIAATTAFFGHPVDVSPVGHFTEFFLLGAALTNALRLHLPLDRSAVLAVVFTSIYGISDELHQILVPSRTCDPMDWLVDTIAALLAAVLVTGILKLRQKRKISHRRTKDISL